LSDRMRSDMVAGLATWRNAASSRGEIIERVPHAGWEAHLIRSGLGVVGFVFEGRPNVFADDMPSAGLTQVKQSDDTPRMESRRWNPLGRQRK
jgi:gamma-glutamyl phosphate reductase